MWSLTDIHNRIGFDAVLALFVRGLFGWNSTAVAILFLALFLPGFVALLAGWLSDRYGAKWPSFAGFVATIPILISLRFVTENTIQHKALLAVLLALAGVTLPFSMTPLMAEISYVIEDEEAKNPGIFGVNGVYGLAYGLFNMVFALGGIIGPIWAGYVVKSAGWGTLTWNFALVSHPECRFSWSSRCWPAFLSPYFGDDQSLDVLQTPKNLKMQLRATITN